MNLETTLIRHVALSGVLSFLNPKYKWIAKDPETGMVYAFQSRPTFCTNRNAWVTNDNTLPPCYIFNLSTIPKDDEVSSVDKEAQEVVLSIRYIKMALTCTYVGTDDHFYKLSDDDAMAYRLLRGVSGWQAVDASKTPLSRWSRQTSSNNPLPMGV